MSSAHEGWAQDYATRAVNEAGAENQTDAIGEGLAAVAMALLDVAQAIREVAQAQNSRP